MRFKELETEMIVHCKTIEEAKKLVKLTDSAPSFLNSWKNGKERTCYRIDGGKIVGFSNISFYKKCGYEITELSDLVEPELTAEEVLKIYVEMCDKGCHQCPLKGAREDGDCERFIAKNIEKAVHLIAEWKAQRGKKETEIEWVYRVFGAENFGEKFFETEDEAIKKCEELVKTQKTKKYARYERVCRVKGE